MGDLLEYEFTREGTRIALLCPYLERSLMLRICPEVEFCYSWVL